LRSRQIWRPQPDGSAPCSIVSFAKEFSALIKILNDEKSGPDGTDVCVTCNLNTHAIDRIVADKRAYHKLCFKCIECSMTLSMANFAQLNGKLYCKPHFKQLFKLKGNYSEGFGEEQHKDKWIKRQDEQPLQPQVDEAPRGRAVTAVAPADPPPPEPLRDERAQSVDQGVASLKNAFAKPEAGVSFAGGG
jgi:hypothetical protein